MKRRSIPNSALACLIIGLLLTTFNPIINRYYPAPDMVKGFMTGLGLSLEVIALAKIQQSKKQQQGC
ncbi:hypothetical protein HH214_14590 [Mucilaginibacter robiniae]|uniref:Uncharacterized protein n=1 Tax=Mucilaginibacter robiniae TaxID=2728022 RepID=A0A7L5E379_9SPHI|nr:hypothetical protein [Mucilaginibacter robiniae]QJD97008.1 hypothetical protein HH214_14590 [Mucilaginibacter robiniae]